MMKRTYTELIRYSSWEERFNYLKLHGSVAGETFGANRYLNQKFYHSKEWQNVRRTIILRDNGCDLGFPGCEIQGKVYIHHINPICYEDLAALNSSVFDPENLICVSYETHNAIHYGGDEYLRLRAVCERSPDDTCPWRKHE